MTQPTSPKENDQSLTQVPLITSEVKHVEARTNKIVPDKVECQADVTGQPFSGRDTQRNELLKVSYQQDLN